MASNLSGHQSVIPISLLPEVLFVGLENIDDSPPLQSLFASCKKWIMSLYADRLEQIENITICKKLIGRNLGFILKVHCIDVVNNTTFYAKMQPASMDTVLIHHLLKNMKCGPDLLKYIPHRRSEWKV